MLNKVTSTIVTDRFDWFFKKVLEEHYDNRRDTLLEANVDSIPAIDYILKTCNKDFIYPPDSASGWNHYFSKLRSGQSNVFQQILLVYLKLDINSYLTLKETSARTRTKDKSELANLEAALKELIVLPSAFDFTNSVIHLATGLWAVDNDDSNLIVSSLSNPAIDLADYFESPKEVCKIIVDGLILNHQPRMALFISRIHHCSRSWDDSFDPIYAFLLVSSGQLIEALKYERMFNFRDNYHDILQRFFEMCSQLNVIKSFNCLNLNIEEEEVLNQHLICESRPVTPSGTQTRVKSSSSKPKPRNRSIQLVQRTPSFNDSPARNTRSARKKKSYK